jgi:hypothetical protein
MNFQLKGLGAEPKWKVIGLVGALVVLAVVFYVNVLAPSDDAPPATRSTAPSASATPNPDFAAGPLRPPASETRARPPLKPGRESVRPEFKLGLRDTQPDPATADPTLRLDLLTKVQAVSMAGGVRNLFQFGSSPPPPVAPLANRKPEPKIEPRPGAAAAPSGPPPTPAPPPITLKFYGYAAPAPSGAKRVFLLDDDDIVVASEGQLVKNRYRVLHIDINSVVIRDEQFKNEQRLQLVEDQGRNG